MAEPRRNTGQVSGAPRQLLLGLLLPALIAGLGWLGLQALDPEQWPIRAVRIEGEATTGLLLVDVDAVRHALEELPWIERAYVRRLWPDRLLLTVVEQQPVARWWSTAAVNSSR
jgi:cell division protein FtsQ